MSRLLLLLLLCGAAVGAGAQDNLLRFEAGGGLHSGTATTIVQAALYRKVLDLPAPEFYDVAIQAGWSPGSGEFSLGAGVRHKMYVVEFPDFDQSVQVRAVWRPALDWGLGFQGFFGWTLLLNGKAPYPGWGMYLRADWTLDWLVKDASFSTSLGVSAGIAFSKQ